MIVFRFFSILIPVGKNMKLEKITLNCLFNPASVAYGKKKIRALRADFVCMYFQS